MHRRQLFLASAAAGAGLAVCGPAAAAGGSSRRGPVVASDGTELFVRDWGEGRPLVFMAGWALTSEAWAYQAAELSDQGFRCVAYDRRGHGRSEDPGAGYDFDTLADDLAAVLEARDLHDVTLVAHSMAGGEVARYMARHKGARVRSIVLLAPATPFLTQAPDNPMGAPAAYFEEVRRGWMRDFPKWIDDNAAPFVTPQTSAAMIAWLKGQMLSCSMKAAVECNRALTAADFRRDLAGIGVPTLVIHGTKDASAPLELTGKRTAELIPGAKLKVIEGAPHGLFVTHLDQVNAEIGAFVRA
jgi:pimeloyl-ACP methyl ester carboxylesterase